MGSDKNVLTVQCQTDKILYRLSDIMDLLLGCHEHYRNATGKPKSRCMGQRA